MTGDGPSLLAFLLLGLALGFRHAFDADHLAAVAATVSRHPRAARAAAVGALWGAGHAGAILVAGGAIVALGVVLPAWAALAAEGAVGAILVWLGVDVMRAIRRERLHVHVHEHDGTRHVHLHAHQREEPHVAHHHAHPGRRAVLVGMAHGLAGSAGLALLAVTATPSRLAGVAFLVVFGVGSTLAMAAATTVVSLPLGLAAARGAGALRWARGASAVASVVMGALLVVEALSAALRA